jgi:hypothetical protein
MSNWSCFKCGFQGTRKQVEDHECPGLILVKDKKGKLHKVID